MFERRLFTFGCSYTNYLYPTWADILGVKFKEFYNFGAAGCSNYFILSAFTEANQVFKFNKDDLIIISWTEPYRADVPINKFWHYQLTHSDIYMKNFFDCSGKIIETLRYISLIKSYIENLKCEYYFLSMNDIKSCRFTDFRLKLPSIDLHVDNDSEDENDRYFQGLETAFTFFEPSLDCLLEPIDTFIGPYDRSKRIFRDKVQNDGHPFVWEYYDYTVKHFPQFITYDEDYRNKLMDIYEQMLIVGDTAKEWCKFQGWKSLFPFYQQSTLSCKYVGTK